MKFNGLDIWGIDEFTFKFFYCNLKPLRFEYVVHYGYICVLMIDAVVKFTLFCVLLINGPSHYPAYSLNKNQVPASEFHHKYLAKANIELSESSNAFISDPSSKDSKIPGKTFFSWKEIQEEESMVLRKIPQPSIFYVTHFYSQINDLSINPVRFVFLTLKVFSPCSSIQDYIIFQVFRI